MKKTTKKLRTLADLETKLAVAGIKGSLPPGETAPPPPLPTLS
jgi:hypothetical protein